MSARSERPAPAASESLLGGAGTLAVARYAVAALGWAGSAIIARRLSGAEFGAFTTVFGLLGLVGFLSELRMSRLVLAAMTGTGDEEAGRVVGSYTALRIVVGLVGWAAAMVVVTVGDFDAEVVRATALGGSILVLMSAWYALILLFQARMWLRSIAISQVVGQAVQLVSILVVAVAGIGSVVWFSMPAVLNAVVGLVWAVVTIRRVLHVRLSVDLPMWWAWIKEAAPLSLGYALETAYFRIDILMLSLMSATLAPVGLYGIGYKFSDLVGSLPVALLGPALALMVDAWSHDRDRFHETFRTSLVLLCLVGVGVGIGFAAFSEDAIRILYGSRYTAAAGAARLLVIGQVLHFFTSLAFTALVAAGRNRLYPVAALAGVVVNVGLNLVLIPEYSYRGSAVATIITEMAVLAVLSAGVARIPDVRPLPWRPLGRIGAAGAALAAGLLALRPFVPWQALAIAAPVAYLGLLHVLSVDGPGGLRALAHNARLEALGGTEPAALGGGRGAPHRLLAVSPHSLVSGAEIVLLRVLGTAAAAGWDVRCACPDGPLAEELRRRGIRHDELADLRLPAGPRLPAVAVMLARSTRAACRLRRVARGTDIVLVNGIHALVALRMARLRVPAAWLVHDVIVRRDRLAFLRAGAPAVDLAIAVSEAAARPVAERGVRTVVVHNGTPWPVAPARHYSGGPKVIGCNAVLTPWKGQDVLLEAVALLGREDVVVELAGKTFPKDGAYEASLRARADRDDLAGSIRFLGHVSDAVEVMRDWRVAVCPSVEPDADPLGVLEAMSIGVPVVGTDHGGIPEFLDSAGLLVRPCDPGALSEAIARLLDDEDLWSLCARSGPATIASSLTLEGQLDALLDVLGDFISTSRGGSRA